MNKVDGLDLLINFLEGALQQKGAQLDDNYTDFDDGMLTALSIALEEAAMIKINMLKENSK